MAESNPAHGVGRRVFPRVLGYNLLLGLLLWLVGLGAFLAFTLQMDNDFARMAREDHWTTAVTANLKTLPGYALLAVLYTLLGYPLLAGRWRPEARGARAVPGRLWRLLLVDLLLFVCSLGVAALGNRAFLDALSRMLSKVAPEVSLYWIYDLHLLEVLSVLLGLLTLWALVRYRSLLTRGRGRIGRLALFDGPLAAVALACILGMGVGRAPPPAFEDAALPNIIIVASDSLRADRLSCYGHDRRTSPHIDALAREGVLFENLQVATASTLESWITILTSKFPTTHGVRYMFPSKERVARVSADPDSLPRILERHGYHTAVSSNWAGNCFNLVDLGFAANRASDIQNFDVFIAEAALMAHLIFPIYFNNRLGEWLYPEVRQITTYLNPDALISRLVGELDRAQEARRPLFGVLFTSHTHLPYSASYPFNQKWVDPGYSGPNRYEIDFEVDAFIQGGFKDDLTPEQVSHIRDLYDGTVSEFDDTVGRVVDVLRERGLLENSILIVTSDHGDDLYEPGTTLGHGTNFFGGDQATRIPVVMRLPGGAHPGTRVRQITRAVDLAPTLLELLRLDRPTSFEGVSLLPALTDPETPLDLPAFAETCYLFYTKQRHEPDALTVETADKTLFVDPGFRNNFVLKERYHRPVLDTKDRMMRTPRWKLVWIPGRKGPILRFYDMLEDPQQERDLSSRNLPVMRRMVSSLAAYWAGATDLRWSPQDDDPDR